MVNQIPGTHQRLQICFQCRSRKVRCDGTLGGCQNCSRLNFKCSFTEPTAFEHLAQRSSDQSHTPDAVLRRRAPRACLPCRQKKVRCQGTRPPCERCHNFGIDCVPSPSRRARQTPAGTGSREPTVITPPRDASIMIPSSIPAVSPEQREASTATDSETSRAGNHVPNEATSITAETPPSSEALTPPGSTTPSLTTIMSKSGLHHAIIKQHLDVFFEYIHPIPGLSFIHQPSLLQTWLDGRHNPKLLKAICGVASRFIVQQNSHTPSDGHWWIEEAERQILQQDCSPLRTDIAALILIAFDHASSRRFCRLIGVISFATRLAYTMRLNHEEASKGFCIQEWRRRIMWGLWMMDLISLDGKTELSCCRSESMWLKLPCNERSYNYETSVETGSLRQPIRTLNKEGAGLYTYIIRLLDIYRRIKEAESTTGEESYLQANAGGFEHELSEFISSLPEGYSISARNICRRISSPSRTTFIMLHVWWYHVNGRLYDILDAQNRREDNVSGSQASLVTELNYYSVRGLQQAISLASLITSVLEVDAGVLITDPMLGFCILSATRRIYLHQRVLSQVPASFHADLVSCLQPYVDILRCPAEVYPTVKLAYEKISNLLNEQQKDQREPTESTLDGFAFSIDEELASIKFLSEDPDRAHNNKESRQKTVVLLSEVEKRNRSDAHNTGTEAHRADGPQRMLQRVPTVATYGTWNANNFAITDVNTRYARMDSTTPLIGDAADTGYYDENLWSMPGTEYLLGAGTEMYPLNVFEHSIVQDDA